MRVSPDHDRPDHRSNIDPKGKETDPNVFRPHRSRRRRRAGRHDSIFILLPRRTLPSCGRKKMDELKANRGSGRKEEKTGLKRTGITERENHTDSFHFSFLFFVDPLKERETEKSSARVGSFSDICLQRRRIDRFAGRCPVFSVTKNVNGS